MVVIILLSVCMVLFLMLVIASIIDGGVDGSVLLFLLVFGALAFCLISVVQLEQVRVEPNLTYVEKLDSNKSPFTTEPLEEIKLWAVVNEWVQYSESGNALKKDMKVLEMKQKLYGKFVIKVNVEELEKK